MSECLGMLQPEKTIVDLIRLQLNSTSLNKSRKRKRSKLTFHAAVKALNLTNKHIQLVCEQAAQHVTKSEDEQNPG